MPSNVFKVTHLVVGDQNSGWLPSLVFRGFKLPIHTTPLRLSPQQSFKAALQAVIYR